MFFLIKILSVLIIYKSREQSAEDLPSLDYHSSSHLITVKSTKKMLDILERDAAVNLTESDSGKDINMKNLDQGMYEQGIRDKVIKLEDECEINVVEGASTSKKLVTSRKFFNSDSQVKGKYYASTTSVKVAYKSNFLFFQRIFIELVLDYDTQTKSDNPEEAEDVFSSQPSSSESSNVDAAGVSMQTKKENPGTEILLFFVDNVLT